MSDRATAGEEGRIDADEAINQLTVLRGELDALRAENQRLRREYLRARQTQYRNAALGLFAIGGVALVGALLFSAFRTVLLVLAGTGGFGGMLLYFLTPDRLVPASVGRATYDAYASVGQRLRRELGLQEIGIYVPLHDEETKSDPVRLYIPHASEWDLPDDTSLQSLFVAPDTVGMRGISLTPTASTLYDEFEQSLTGPLSTEIDDLLNQLTEAAVEQFELAHQVDGRVDPASNSVTIRVTSPAYGSLTEFDHPLVSFIGTGLADALSVPIELDSVVVDEDETFVVTYRHNATQQGE